jgi:uncharacterized protein
MTERTRLRRIPDRAVQDRAEIEAVLDEALVCHLGFVHDGHPVVTPTLTARIGDQVYVHGSSASRTLRSLAGGIDVCLTVTLVDGLVLARSAFHHSINYRSVMVFGRALPFEDPNEKLQALEAFTEKIAPGRWAEVRAPSRQELKGTSILRIPLAEVSAKARTGPPLDDEEDYALDVWAGVVPITTERHPPRPDPRLPDGVPLPDYLG